MDAAGQQLLARREYYLQGELRRIQHALQDVTAQQGYPPPPPYYHSPPNDGGLKLFPRFVNLEKS